MKANTGFTKLSRRGLLATLVAAALLGAAVASVLFAGLIETREFRAGFGAYFAVGGALTPTAYGVAGELTGEAWRIGAVGLGAHPVGWFVGDQTFRWLNSAHFRRAVLAALVSSAVVTAMRVVSDW